MSLNFQTPVTFGPRVKKTWAPAAGDALAIADIHGLVVTRERVGDVVRSTLATWGGSDGVRAELDRRLADTPDRTRRRLAWARETLSQLDRSKSWPH